MPDDRVSIHAMSESEDNVSLSVENGGPSSRPPTPQNEATKKSPLISRKKKVKRLETESSNDSSSESDSDSSSSDSESDDSDCEQESVTRTVRGSVFSETISNTSYTRFNPEISSRKSKSTLSNDQMDYCKRYFKNFVKDEVVQNNILETAPIPDEPLFKVKTMDEFVMPTMAKIGVEFDRGAEKGIQSIQKRILRTMGPVSKLWQLVDGIREKSKHTSRVDNVDIEAMCQYVEKSVCLLGQASLAVDRHRRINTLVKITDDYKKAKDLLDENQETLATSSSKLFGDDFKKVLKKASKTLDDATIIVKGIGGKRKGRKKHKFGAKRYKSGGQGGSFRRPDYSRDRESHKSFNNDPFLSGPSERTSYSGGRGGRGGYRGGHRNKEHRGANKSNRLVPKIKRGSERNKQYRLRNTISIQIINRSKKCSKNDKGSKISDCSWSKFSTNRGKIKELSPKLASNHQRSLHTGNCKGVSIRTNKSTGARKVTKNSKSECNRKGNSIKRNSGSITKRSSRDCEFLSGPIYKSNVCSSKKGRGKSTSNKFKKFKQLCELPSFQDGGSIHVKRSPKTKRLAVQNRSERCISYPECSPRRQSLSQIHMGSDHLSIQVGPFRSGFSPKNIHKNSKTSRRTTTKSRNSSNNLFRRHSFNGGNARKVSRKQRHNNIPLTKLGVCDKLGKVSNNAMSEVRVFGNPNRHNSHDILFARNKGFKNKGIVQSNSRLKEINSTRSSKTDRNFGCNRSSNFTGKSAVQISSNATHQSNDEKQKLRISSRANKGSSNRNNLVDRANRCIKWARYHIFNPRYYNNIGCLKHRLGGRLSRYKNRRCLGCTRIRFTHKCKRAFGCFLCNKSVCKIKNKQICPFKNRQHNSSCLYKQNGGNKINKISAVNERNLGTLPTKKLNRNSRTSARQIKYDCGLGIQKRVRFQRLDARQRHFQNISTSIRSMPSRPICKSVKPSNSQIRKLAARSRCFGNGRVSHFMAQYRWLYFSAILFNRKMPSKNSKRKSDRFISSTSMASSTMVSVTPTYVNGRPNQNSMLQQPINILTGSGPSFNPGGEFETCSMESFGGPQITSSLSEEAKELHKEAWRPGTRASYKSAWSRWTSWCSSKQINTVQTFVVNIIEFLTLLYNENKQYRTINTYRSAISKGHNLVEGVPVGQHRHIVHHMRAIFNVRTPMPRYQNSWDVNTVLSFIQHLGDNVCLSLKQLTHKLTILLALTSAGRASELHKLNIDFMLDKGNYISFKMPSLTKTCKPGKMLPEQKFYTFEDKNLCVVDCLRFYLKTTTDFRLVDDNINRKWLLLSLVKPHHPVTVSSISRWVRCIIQDSGIDTSLFKAHSTRAASTSKASRSGLSTKEIMEQARWSKESTFTRFYNKPLLDDTNEYQNAVLSRS